ncbi:thioredoxin [Brachionus plicatilis]|uniref:Thioredoxin n=1 Tax=Brachionus plicatilis TaxID=10195 RepID=A0A3M7SVB1_BRAPC|nr:thioredoxin [Brachionus plicatilis]
MSLVYIKSESEYRNRLMNKQYRTTIAMFSGKHCAPCKQITPFYQTMARRYRNIQFLKIESTELPFLCQSSKVRGLPSFFFFQKGRKVYEITGANQQSLSSAIKHYASK